MFYLDGTSSKRTYRGCYCFACIKTLWINSSDWLRHDGKWQLIIMIKYSDVQILLHVSPLFPKVIVPESPWKHSFPHKTVINFIYNRNIEHWHIWHQHFKLHWYWINLRLHRFNVSCKCETFSPYLILRCRASCRASSSRHRKFTCYVLI